MRLQYWPLHKYKESGHGFPFKTTATALLLLMAISSYVVLHQDAQNMQHTLQVETTQQNENWSVPLIVGWTKFFEENMSERLLPTLRNCEYQCTFVDRKEHETFDRSAAAYILHGRDMNVSDLPKRSSKNLVVLYLMESPLNVKFQMYQVLPDYFNATLTYRLDSNYFFPYGHFQPRISTDTVGIIEYQEILNAIKRKKKGSLVFISNCYTPSRREKTIRELGEFTEVTVRGWCENALSVNENTMNISCRIDCSEDALIATHRFYIAFENSYCNDYITEKFFERISQLLVPIVMHRRIYEAAGVPSHSFIAADDFNSLSKLGDYLNFLRKNDTEYLRYFEWTKQFRKPNTYVSNALCKLCEDIHKGKLLKVNDVKEYYEKDQCLPDQIPNREVR